MYDAGKVLAGLLVFVALVSFPVWFNLGSGTTARAVTIERPLGERCVLDGPRMRAEHMELLMDWRDAVVREGRRVAVAADGTRVRRSLSGGCLGCHRSKQKSCDRCHEFLGVRPYCWDCHVDPGEVSR